MPRRKNSTSFGEPGANPTGPGRRKPPPLPYIAPPEDGAPQQLQDLRHVYLNGKEHDSTMGHAIARGILKKDTVKFLELLAKLEREHKGAKAPGGGEEPVDEGSEKAIALCEQLIRGFEENEAKENAELARRPDAAEIGATLQRSLASALEREKRLQERVKELERNGPAKESA